MLHLVAVSPPGVATTPSRYPLRRLVDTPRPVLCLTGCHTFHWKKFAVVVPDIGLDGILQGRTRSHVWTSTLLASRSAVVVAHVTATVELMLII